MSSPMQPVIINDLKAYLGDARLDENRAQLMIDLAVEACTAVVNPLPEAARFVVIRVAARGYTTVTSPRQQNLADAGSPFGASGGMGGIFVTSYDIVDLQRAYTPTVVASSIQVGVPTHLTRTPTPPYDPWDPRGFPIMP